MSMRALTPDEIAQLHPTPQDGTPIYVTGPGSGGGNPIGTGGGGGGGGGGGNGDPAPPGASRGPAGPGHRHETSEDYFYTVNKQLTADQTKVLDRIVNYGIDHGYSSDTINNIANQAFHESQLGANETSNQGRVWLFMYDSDTWNEHYASMNLNRGNDDDQITAMYKESEMFPMSRWQQGQQNGSIPQNLSYDDYVEYKHHGYYGDGGVTHGAAWDAYEATYHRDESAIQFNVIG